MLAYSYQTNLWISVFIHFHKQPCFFWFLCKTLVTKDAHSTKSHTRPASANWMTCCLLPWMWPISWLPWELHKRGSWGIPGPHFMGLLDLQGFVPHKSWIEWVSLGQEGPQWCITLPYVDIDTALLMVTSYLRCYHL